MKMKMVINTIMEVMVTNIKITTIHLMLTSIMQMEQQLKQNGVILMKMGLWHEV